jgi:hypothetical protein
VIGECPRRVAHQPAVLEATEEALLNSLAAATTTAGAGGHISYAVPHDCLRRRP